MQLKCDGQAGYAPSQKVDLGMATLLAWQFGLFCQKKAIKPWKSRIRALNIQQKLETNVWWQKVAERKYGKKLKNGQFSCVALDTHSRLGYFHRLCPSIVNGT